MNSNLWLTSAVKNEPIVKYWAKKNEEDGTWIIFKAGSTIDPVMFAFPANVENGALKLRVVAKSDRDIFYAVRIADEKVLFNNKLLVHDGIFFTTYDFKTKKEEVQAIRDMNSVSKTPCKRHGCDKRIERWVPWAELLI